MPLDNPLLYGVHARFWQQPHLVTSVAAGVGLHAAAGWLEGRPAAAVGAGVKSKRPERECDRRAVEASGVVVGAWVLATAAAAALMLRGMATNDHSGTRYLENYARALLDPLPRGSIIMLSWDQQWTVTRYLQTCENYRWPLAR